MERRHDSMLSSTAAKKQDDHKLKSVIATITGQLTMLQNSAERRRSHSRSHTYSPSHISTDIPQNSGKKRRSHSRSHTHSPSHISTDIPQNSGKKRSSHSRSQTHSPSHISTDIAMMNGRVTMLQNSGEKRSSHSRSQTYSPSHISTDIPMINGRVTMLENSGEKRSSHSRSQTHSPSHISTDIPMITGQVTMLENSGGKRSSHSRSQTHSPSQISTDIPMMNGRLTTLQNNAEKEESCTKRHVEPCFEDYQLIGDSILLRFSEQLLFYRCKTDEYNGARSLGLCVSGQTVGELWRRIVSEMYPISKKVILLIGTNDMLRDTEMDLMKRKLKTVVKELMSVTEKIVVLTLPPVPRLSHRPEHWQRLNEYNAYIKRREKYKNVKVADITSLFLIGPERCRTDCYELFYAGTNRPDRVHLNRLGLQKIYSFLLEKQLLTD